MVHHEFMLINRAHSLIPKKLIKMLWCGLLYLEMVSGTEGYVAVPESGKGRPRDFVCERVAIYVCVSVVLHVCGQKKPPPERLWTGPGNQRKIRAGADSSARAQVLLGTPRYRHTLHAGEDYVNSVAFRSHEYK